MKIHLVLFAYLFAIAGFTQNAQTSAQLEGMIVDKGSQEPLAFARVFLYQQNHDLLAVTQTDFDGKYTFPNVPLGTYSLTINMLYYDTLQISPVHIAEVKTYTVNAELGSAETLDCVMVTYHKRSPKLAGGIVSISKRGSRDTGGGYYHKKSTESYAKIEDNNYKDVKSDPLSTFSIDVDKAAYSNVRRFLSKGEMPPADAVRVEEMINYFQYDYPEPESDMPFSVSTEYTQCAWNKKHQLVQIGLKAKSLKMEDAPANNLVFLIDVSGSMQSEDKLELLKKGFGLLVDQLRPQDKVALVVYAGAAGLVLEPTKGNQKEKIKSALHELEAGGSTAGAEGIELAYKVAKENYLTNGNNRVILATDGDFNVGTSSESELEKLIERKREDGIFLSVLGFGTGNLQDSKMEKMADNGNGNYAYIDNIFEAKKVLVTEMGGTLFTVAKDVKIQVEFNPEQVKSYRLIGYENRLLNKEDFNDDKKDAGEIGAAHTVTALYEIIPSKSNEKIAATVDPLKYQTYAENEGFSRELMTVKLRYKEPNGTKSKLLTAVVENNLVPLEKASENVRFASAVAEFGLLLRDSEFKGDANYEDLILRAESAKGADPEGYRAEFVRLVKMAQDLTAAP